MSNQNPDPERYASSTPREMPLPSERRRNIGIKAVGGVLREEHDRRGSDWQDRANCLNQDPKLFFPPSGKKDNPQLLEAKKVCSECKVKAECLQYAFKMGCDTGVWGGLSEDERRALKRRNDRARRHNSV